MWFVLVALLGWGLHLWRGVFPPEGRELVCMPRRNPYRDSARDPVYTSLPADTRR